MKSRTECDCVFIVSCVCASSAHGRFQQQTSTVHRSGLIKHTVGAQIHISGLDLRVRPGKKMKEAQSFLAFPTGRTRAAETQLLVRHGNSWSVKAGLSPPPSTNPHFLCEISDKQRNDEEIAAIESFINVSLLLRPGEQTNGLETDSGPKRGCWTDGVSSDPTRTNIQKTQQGNLKQQPLFHSACRGAAPAAGSTPSLSHVSKKKKPPRLSRFS